MANIVLSYDKINFEFELRCLFIYVPNLRDHFVETSTFISILAAAETSFNNILFRLTLYTSRVNSDILIHGFGFQRLYSRQRKSIYKAV